MWRCLASLAGGRPRRYLSRRFCSSRRIFFSSSEIISSLIQIFGEQAKQLVPKVNIPKFLEGLGLDMVVLLMATSA
jgi:hypothetical protein